MKKPKVGDKVYLVNVGTNVRSGGCDPKYVTISKVGRKYFTITESNFSNKMFSIDTWLEKTEYSSNWKLYTTENEYTAHIESQKWRDKYSIIFDSFAGGNDFTVEQYRRAAEIFDITI